MDIHGGVALVTNHPAQIHALFRPSFAAGSALARMKPFVRFCSDAACANPLGVVPAVSTSADVDGNILPSTLSVSGMGTYVPWSVTSAPLGQSYLQFIGDTQASTAAGLAACSDTTNCPGMLDVLQTDATAAQANNAGGASYNLPSSTVAITVTEGGTVDVGNLKLGAFHLPSPPEWSVTPDERGTFLLAVSNVTDTFRNTVLSLDFSTATPDPASVMRGETVLQLAGADFPGDICGFIRGPSTLFVIGVDAAGARLFELDPTTLQQVSDAPRVTIPPVNAANPDTYPWPCRGLYAETGTEQHLYLLNFKGAGSLTTSSPHAFYDVHLNDNTFTTPFDSYNNHAWRGLARTGANQLVTVDMSWSSNAVNNAVHEDRLYPITLDANGLALSVGAPVLTGFTSDDRCDSTLNWPTTLATVELGGTPVLAMGHDHGLALFDPSTLASAGDVDLRFAGRLMSQLESSPTNPSTLFVLPQCKALNADATFELPYGAATEAADQYLMAALDMSGSTAVPLDIADLNNDSQPDPGVDLDFWFLKRWIRAHGTTLPIPPVVYTAPSVAVGSHLMMLRGTGIQGNGGSAISSSGLGQVQDVGWFDLATGRGLVLNGYMPWLDGLSAEAGTGAAVWGYEIRDARDVSVGAMVYLPR